jgi:HNH endonuclease
MKPFTYKGKTVQVSRSGQVYFKGKKLNQSNEFHGYKTVCIKSKHFGVHRVVCEAFHGEPPTLKHQANHLNGIRDDNRAVNLRWDTSSDNHKHAYNVLGRKHSRGQLGRSGYLHHNSKPVDKIDLLTGKVLETFGSINEAVTLGCFSGGIIHKVIKGIFKHHKGFKWAYNPKGNTYKPKYTYFFENGIKKRKLNNNRTHI